MLVRMVHVCIGVKMGNVGTGESAGTGGVRRRDRDGECGRRKRWDRGPRNSSLDLADRRVK